jgi:hypothetical protein
MVRALERDIDQRFPSAAAMRDAISGGSAEVTPSPIMLSASVGDPLRISLAEPDGPSDPGAASIALLQEPAPPAPSDRRRANGSADPFAPPPDSEASPLLADDLDRPLALRPSPDRRPPSEPRQEPREIVVEESARPGAAARGKKTMAPERLALVTRSIAAGQGPLCSPWPSVRASHTATCAPLPTAARPSTGRDLQGSADRRAKPGQRADRPRSLPPSASCPWIRARRTFSTPRRLGA